MEKRHRKTLAGRDVFHNVPDVEPIVRKIWLTNEQPCGKRPVPVLPQWLPYCEAPYGELCARQGL